MNIRIKSLIAAVFLMSGFTSCSDILDTAPYHQVGTVTMWTTENLTDLGINGIYANLRNWGPYGNTLNPHPNPSDNNNPHNANGMGQWGYETMGPLGMSHNVISHLNGNMTPNDGGVNNMWRRLYEGVHRANDAIVNIPVKSPVSDEKKGRLIAEAKFLRAFHYFRLNELWRGVPYYDEPVLVEECTKGRETEAFIWDRILDDLNDCINEEHFPDNDFREGRVTKGAAYALRGKTYMHLGRWQNAVNDFQKVGECGYGLFTGNYKALFTQANNHSREMIFAVQNFNQAFYGSIAHQYLGTRSSQGSCWGDHGITVYAVELYENSDGTPFNWDDYIPGYSAMPPAHRVVYFLRDTLDAGGSPFHRDISNTVRTALNALPENIRTLYMPHGNEARIRTAYDARDPRLAANVVTPYSEYIGVNIIAPSTDDFAFTYRWPFVSTPRNDGYVVGDFQCDFTGNMLYMQRKFVYEGYNGPTFNRQRGEISDPLIRYADVLLMWAEALIELNLISEAKAKVVEVRERAGMMITSDANFADQSTARKYVRDERRREMLGEGGAYFDELRWGTLRETTYPATAAEATGFKAGHVQVWGAQGRGVIYRWPDLLAGDKFVWPIPRAEIERNPNLTPTPGWTY